MVPKDHIILFFFSASVLILFMVATIFDFFLLFRKHRLIAAQEKEINQRKIDELIIRKEVESVNSLLKGQNSERRRISQELHDRLGSILFTAKLYHSNIERKVKEIQADQKEGMQKLTGLLDDAVKEVRRISHDLYAGSLANFGYSISITQLAKALMEANDLNIDYFNEGEVDKINEEVQQDLYAITQELLSNTLKHAKATKVEIQTRTNGELVFHYHDNGNGFDQSRSFSGIGLKNIETRVAKYNGKLTLESSSEKGTFYFISIPLQS